MRALTRVKLEQAVSTACREADPGDWGGSGLEGAKQRHRQVQSRDAAGGWDCKRVLLAGFTAPDVDAAGAGALFSGGLPFRLLADPDSVVYPPGAGRAGKAGGGSFVLDDIRAAFQDGNTVSHANFEVVDGNLGLGKTLLDGLLEFGVAAGGFRCG